MRLGSPPDFDDDELALGGLLAAQRLVPGEDRHAVGFEGLPRTGRDFGVLADHDARQHLDLRHLRAQPGEALRQLAADRPATEHHQPRRQFAQAPQRVAGQVADIVQAWQRRHERRRAGGDDDAAGGQRLRAAVVLLDLYGPRIDQPGVARDDIDAQRGVARHRIVRLHRAHDTGHARHHLREVDARVRRSDAVVLRMPDLPRQRRGPDQGLARHAAVVQAVAAHLVRLDQGHLGFHRRGDVGRDQTGRAGADDHQVAIERARPRAGPARIDAARLRRIDDLLGDQREDSEQHERGDQRRLQDAAGGFDLRQLRAGVDVGDGAGEHAELADPVEGPGAHLREPEQQVDRRRRDGRDQPQREQVERSVAGNALVDFGQPVAQARAHAVGKHVARRQERERGADRRGERHHQGADHEAEQRPAGQRHHRAHRQRQREDRDVDQRVDADHPQRRFGVQRRKTRLLRLQGIEAEQAPDVEGEVRRDQRRQHGHDQQLLLRHGSPREAAFGRAVAGVPYTADAVSATAASHRRRCA